MLRRLLVIGADVMVALLVVSSPLLAQITTGTVTGSVKDPTGAVIPGATVVLTSETRGTKSAPAVTNEAGTYVFPNVTPDTYTVEVTLQGFKTVLLVRSTHAAAPSRRCGSMVVRGNHGVDPSRVTFSAPC